MELDELAKLLRELRQASDDEIRARFDRSLPFADALFDRWERAERLGFGPGASIYDSALVYGDVSVGAGTWVGPLTLLDGSGSDLVIGSYCSISAGVHIYTHDTVMWALSGGRRERRTGSVRVGDCCHVGSQSVIAPGAEIGDHSVVAANSFVNRSVSSYSIVGGSPARVIGRVECSGDDISLRYEL
jgi:carbonic anhydrase/acetyltransferase-like protein (isoleucine patch superfamily)